jgi:5-hydroxyisourate hydrolase-like protein (transthyretin family)
MLCHPERSAAKVILCHPERSAAKRRAVEGPAVVFPHLSRIAFALTTVFLAAHALSSAQNLPTPLTGPYTIAGRVVNAATGQPVRRAVVAALSEEDSHIVRSIQTDADGRFSLDHLPPGKYPLTASRRGFRTAFYDEHDDYNSAIVTGPDQDTTHLIFHLMPGAVLRGVVTDDGGDPAENASVILFKREKGSARDIKQTDGAMTDDTGAYEFSNLAPGEYYVAVVTTPWYAVHPPRTASNADFPLDVAYSVTYFDSTTDEASATPIVLEAGTRQEADISLHAVPALRLQVAAPRKGETMVQPELRTMVFGTQVSAETANAFDPLRSAVVEFHSIAPGHYELVQGDPPRIAEIDATSSQAVDPNAGAPAVTVTGTLRSTHAPLPESANVMLESVSGSSQPPMQMNARKGQFRFDAVPPGNWALSANAQGNALAIVALSAGGAAIPGNQFTVKDRPVSVVAIVSPSLAHVQGFARSDGKGVAGAMIVLVPKQRSAYRALVRRDQSDSDGSFNLRDVPPGQYTVVAIADGWKLDWTDSDTMARYLPHGISVTVSDQPGGVVTLPDPVPVQ